MENKVEIKKVKTPLKSYKFWAKIFATILLACFAGFIAIWNEFAIPTSLVFVGGSFVIYSIYRLFLLFKVYKNVPSRLLGIIEILIDIVLGSFSILMVILSSALPLEIVDFVFSKYNLFIAVLLWFRGFTYFTTVFAFNETTEKKTYFIHLAIITVGSMLFTISISIDVVAILLEVVSGLLAIFFFVEGFKDYRRYLKNLEYARIEKEVLANHSNEIVKEESEEKVEEKVEEVEEKVEEETLEETTEDSEKVEEETLEAETATEEEFNEESLEELDSLDK